MDDDRRKPPRGGARKPAGGNRRDGGKPGRPGAPGADRPQRSSASRTAGKAGAAERKPFRKDDRGEGKPFAKPFSKDGAKRPYTARAKPAGAEDGTAAKRPYSKPFRKDAEKRPFTPREDRADRPAAGRPFAKPFSKDGAKRPYVARDKPAGAEDGAPPRKPYAKPFRKDGERPFTPRDKTGDGSASAGKPFRKQFRTDGPRSRGDDRRPEGRRPGGSDRPRPGPDASGRPNRDIASAAAADVRREGGDEGEVHVERIAKRLARAGIASRRDAEELIAAGRIKVNGRKLDSPAFNVRSDDRIELDGTEIPPVERTRLFLFNKPAGLVTTNRDPEGRKTVFDVLPADLPRLMTIGRLDINTEGLLLLTNDGGLARVLELPATGWLRRYRVRVHGKVDEKALAGLKDGIAVDGVFYGSIEASLDREQGSNAWLTIGLREGKNREVKNILGGLGLEVSRLIRISYGPFQLGEMKDGEVQEIRGRMLRDQLGERLIEEAGANFEAPVMTPFSRNAEHRRADEVEAVPARPVVRRDGERGRIGEGGLIKNRKRREGSRDEALGKLSTRPDKPKFERGGKPERPKPERGERPARAGKFGDRPDRNASFASEGGDKPRPGRKPEREQKPIVPPGGRKANVWMAPGARPIGTGRAAAEKAEVEARRAAKKSYAKPGGRPQFAKPRSDRTRGESSGEDRSGGGNAPKGPRGGGRNADRRR